MGSTWIIIVNFRTAELVIDCLRSLSTQVADLAGGRVIVIDNASGDESVVKLCSAIEHECWSSWSEVIPLDRNGGFAFGNNAGFRRVLDAAKSVDYFMLLNPDTVVRPGAVKALVDFMDTNPRAGIVGSKLQNARGDIDCSAHTFPSPLSELDGGARLGVLSRLLRRYAVNSHPQAVPHLCDWVSGASMMIRRQVVENIGWLDEGYFLYFEEVDFCWRAKSANWDIWYVPESRVMHLEGASTGIRVKAQRRAKYWYDSRRRFFIKNYGVLGLALADILWSFGRTTLVFRRMLGLGGGGKEDDPAWFMSDLLWGDLKSLITGNFRGIRKL